ncbi:hypothetical protein [Segatella copri]|uniref:Uncharacterized protein n=1 Tax=Segatella copri TaxID=165179 RepID=A0AAW5U0K3_9BACT|nr:hypothetical protein [Segatella copri]MCW4094578.1 hypothetical protein [Segatella copri]
MAKALGKTEDAAWLTRLANERRASSGKHSLMRLQVRPSVRGMMLERKGQLIDTQTSYALPLAFHGRW